MSEHNTNRTPAPRWDVDERSWRSVSATDLESMPVGSAIAVELGNGRRLSIAKGRSGMWHPRTASLPNEYLAGLRVADKVRRDDARASA